MKVAKIEIRIKREYQYYNYSFFFITEITRRVHFYIQIYFAIHLLNDVLQWDRVTSDI